MVRHNNYITIFIFINFIDYIIEQKKKWQKKTLNFDTNIDRFKRYSDNILFFFFWYFSACISVFLSPRNMRQTKKVIYFVFSSIYRTIRIFEMNSNKRKQIEMSSVREKGPSHPIARCVNFHNCCDIETDRMMLF